MEVDVSIRYGLRKTQNVRDDIAAECRSELRNSQMASGEGLRLQPSAENVFVPPNEAYDTMLQQFLNARYLAPAENMWTASASMPASLPQQVSTSTPRTIPSSRPIPIWTANPWTIPTSVPVPMGFATQTTIGSTTTIPTSCPLLPNSVLQGMEHLSMFAPRTVQDICSELFIGLRDVSSQSASPWTVPPSASAPTNSMFQMTNVTPCNGQASSPMPASSVSQQMRQLSVTPQPLPVDGDRKSFDVDFSQPHVVSAVDGHLKKLYKDYRTSRTSATLQVKMLICCRSIPRQMRNLMSLRSTSLHITI